MKIITFQEYTDFGFSTIPENVFERWITEAFWIVERWSFGRVYPFEMAEDDPTEYADPILVERNKRGICAVADLVYGKNALSSATASGAQLKGFSNEGYSETYATMTPGDIEDQFNNELMRVMFMYFTQYQLHRRAGFDATWR